MRHHTQNPIQDPSKIDFVVTTEPTKHSQVRRSRSGLLPYRTAADPDAWRGVQVKAFVAEVEKQDFTLAPPLFFGCL